MGCQNVCFLNLLNSLLTSFSKNKAGRGKKVKIKIAQNFERAVKMYVLLTYWQFRHHFSEKFLKGEGGGSSQNSIPSQIPNEQPKCMFFFIFRINSNEYFLKKINNEREKVARLRLFRRMKILKKNCNIKYWKGHYSNFCEEKYKFSVDFWF